MPSTATPIAKLEDQATGENASTWGTKTDNNLELIEQMAKSVYPYSCAASGDITLDDTQFVANDTRRAMIRLTGSRSAAGNVVVPTREGWWFFENLTTGGYAMTIKTSAGTGVSLPASGGVYALMCDGTNVVDMELVNDTLLQTELGAISAGGFYTSSSTSNAIAVAGTNQSYVTAESGKAFTPGTPLRIARTSDPANYYMDAITTAYSGTALDITVTDAVGSGTFSAWSISVAGGPSITSSTIVRRTVTTNDTIELTDNGGLIDCTSGSFTLTLPAAATAGNGFNVRVLNSGSGTVVVDGDGSETINGDASYALRQYAEVHLICTGTAWFVLGPWRKIAIQAKDTAYSISASDIGTVVGVSTTAVVSATAAATLGSGFTVELRNTGSGIVTFDADGSEVIKDNVSVTQTAIYLHRGQHVRLLCDGSGWLVTDDARSPYETWAVAMSDETTSISSGAAKTTLRFPYGFEMIETPIASVTSASTSGVVTVDINDDGTSIFSGNKLTIDANEKDSTSAAAVATISVPTRIALGSIMTFDIDTAGTNAKGLKVYMLGRRTP